MTFQSILDLLYKILNARLFTITQTEVTLSVLLVFFALFFAVLFFSRLIARKVVQRILSRAHIEEGLQYTFQRITEYTLILIGAIIVFQFVGINLSGLAVIFGLLSVGIGFGLQNITSNFISGLILLLERPIKVGDRVRVGDIEGDVLEINIRSTTVRSLENVSIIVPNSEFITSQVVNLSHGDLKIRLDIDVGVSYDSDLDTVLRSLSEVARENPEVLDNPEPLVHLVEFADSAWVMRLRAWIADPKRHHGVRSDINCAIVRKFHENKVVIAYPQRDLHVCSSVPLPLVITKTTAEEQ
ncbi:MAG TPA: mechanosensitive ion channel [Deltaproteobacteria bacterium]|nr:mechanosensitive ion channel [Deltaproteobacteria bacterium]